MMSSKEIKELETKIKGKLVYLTTSGSRLYGTHTPDSDLDIKGIFIPSTESLLLGDPVTQYSSTTGQNNSSNSADDIDINLQSIHTFFNFLQKSETGAVDTLFSMFRNDTILYENKAFTDTFKRNYKDFLNSNMKSFIGYALGQTKKFGIKGARYEELDSFIKYLKSSLLEHKKLLLEDRFSLLKQHLEEENYNYIKFIQAPGPRGSGDYRDIAYISVLGKLFEGRVTIEYFTERVEKLYNQFGHRTISTAKTVTKTDYKALSHAYRIASEVKELLETSFIKFPLKDSDYIRDIKLGKYSASTIVENIRTTLENVDSLILNANLPEECDKFKIDSLLLSIVKESK